MTIRHGAVLLGSLVAMGSAARGREIVPQPVDIAGTGWRVTPPRTFVQMGPGEWRREFGNTSRSFGGSSPRVELISAGTTIVDWHPGESWDTSAACAQSGATRPAVEGRHYGHPTFSYTCKGNGGGDVYDLVYRMNPPGEGDVAMVIELMYTVSEPVAQNGMLADRYRATISQSLRHISRPGMKPSLPAFRQMEASLAPVAEEELQP